MSREVQRALAQFPTDSGRRWLQFVEPRQRYTAWSLPEVLPTLQRVQAASDNGYWAVGFVSYDASPAFDQALTSRRDPSVPLAAFAIYEGPVDYDEPSGGTYDLSDWTYSQDQDAFEATVKDIKGPIRLGTTYQVNHTMRLRAEFQGDSEGFFARLAQAQNARHSIYIDLGNAAVCSSSPELFFSRRGQRITTRPMKGTRARHPSRSADALSPNNLVASEKDRAENTMIVDMMRNDLGRIAKVGTVQVPKLHMVESYPTVHQMTSTVTAVSTASLPELFTAMFPAASITGAPKVSTCKLITTFESEPRGLYTGAIGVVAPGGDCEFNVAIRTAWIDKSAQTAEYGVGCGIVWDSDPEQEWHEALQKVRVLRRCRPSLRLLETMRWTPRQGVVLLDRHVERLSNSATHFGFTYDPTALRHRLEDLNAPGDLRVRVLLDHAGAIEIQSTVEPGLETDNSAELPPPPGIQPSLQVGFDTEPVDVTDEFLYHKTTDRRRYVQAQEAVGPAADDVIMWNSRGEITETSLGNIVVELDDQLLTPPVYCGLLAGTFRSELLASKVITESVLAAEHLLQASRVFMVNSVRGWTELRIDFSTAPNASTHDS